MKPRHFVHTVILPAVIMILRKTCVNGVLVVKPTDSEVVVEQNVRLRCSTDETMEVNWLYIPLGTSQSTPIYFDKEVVNGYNKRYRVEEDEEEGKYDLILQNAQTADAGTYRCHDKVGSGEWSDAELIVLESEPKCKAQDLTFCNVATGTFNISCSIIYAGRIQPRIACSSPHTFNSSVIREELGNRVVYSIQSTAHWSGTNNISVLCQTQLSNILSPIEVKTPYAFNSSSTANVSSNELVECKANSSGPCSRYKWIEMKTGQISMQQTLKTNSLGKHECMSECQLQSQSSACVVTSLTIEVTPPGSEGDTPHVKIGIIIGIVIFMVIVICTAVMIHKKRQKERRYI